jgi:hypothetical protein
MAKTVIKAKGKIRREKLDAEAEALKEYEQNLKVVKAPKESKSRDEAVGYEVIGILTAEIQEIYSETGFELDEINAKDKALIIWRDLHYRHHVRTHHKEISHKLCKEHS